MGGVNMLSGSELSKFLVNLISATTLSLFASTASASLVEFQQFNGNVGLSTDGWGALGSASAGAVGVISASAPTGSTVVAAYLYTATQRSTVEPTTVTFDGAAVNYDVSVENTSTPFGLTAHRADVTSLIAPMINGSLSTTFNFSIDEGTDGISDGTDPIDGHALVVVYGNAALPDQTVAILDGFSSVNGDIATISFSAPLDPTDPLFVAEMALGINFSCCDQKSTVEVNGLLMTENAGNFDDGSNLADGSLITVGSFDDPLSPLNPTYANDRERYDLSSFIASGDTSIIIETLNPSNDDNIFLATFLVSGEAVVSTNPIPLPAAFPLFAASLAGACLLGGWRRKRRAATAADAAV